MLGRFGCFGLFNSYISHMAIGNPQGFSHWSLHFEVIFHCYVWLPKGKSQFQLVLVESSIWVEFPLFWCMFVGSFLVIRSSCLLIEPTFLEEKSRFSWLEFQSMPFLAMYHPHVAGEIHFLCCPLCSWSGNRSNMACHVLNFIHFHADEICATTVWSGIYSKNSDMKRHVSGTR